MGEGTRSALLVEGQLDEEIVESAISAGEGAPLDERIAAGLEAVVAIAETDPAAARLALQGLRSDHEMLARLEACLEGGAERATFGLGAALQLALTELSMPQPDLRRRVPDMERWLKGDW